MIFGKKNKFHNSMIEALTEPAFVFSKEYEFLFCNVAGNHTLKTLGYTDNKKTLQYAALIQDLDGTPVMGEFDNGHLLRLVPPQKDSHMTRLSASLNAIPWGLITIDLNDKNPSVLFTNKKAEDFLQLLQENMMGQPITDIFRVFGIEDDLSSHITSNEIVHYDFETKYEGRTIWYRFHFIPYSTETPYCLIVIEDTTEGKIMEGQYFQSQRLEALGQLAGGVAHDFNNILSIIDGYARIAKKSIKGNPDALNYLERIAQSVQRGSALTSQLLTFGRHKVAKDSVIDLGALIKDQEPLLRPLMDASIALSINVEDNVFVQVAPDHICQILLNLCINSRDAMPEGGHLMLESGRGKDNTAFLGVIDTGLGMSPEVKSKMFDPFYTTKDQGKGTGLGLSMVYGLVKDMKGEISVASKVGSGTSITIRIPASEKALETQGHIEEDYNGSIHLNGLTALVAEDEADLLNLTSGMLEEMGIKVLKASNGNEALLIQEEYEGEIDFLLTDVVMPELNGVRLAELFESLRPDSKIMFMSGYPANGQMARVPLPEGALLMPKPVDFEKLSLVLKSMVKNQNHDLKDKWQSMTGQWRMA